MSEIEIENELGVPEKFAQNETPYDPELVKRYADVIVQVIKSKGGSVKPAELDFLVGVQPQLAIFVYMVLGQPSPFENSPFGEAMDLLVTNGTIACTRQEDGLVYTLNASKN